MSVSRFLNENKQLSTVHLFLLFTYFLLSQISCTINTSIKDLGESSSTDKLAPSVVESLTMIEPAINQGIDNTPTIRISGVIAEEEVKLYIDSLCSNEVGSGKAVGSSIDLTSRPLNDGSYTFYARTFGQSGESSPCSTASIDYRLSVPTQLVITQQPTNANSMAAISPDVKVEIRNANNQLIDFATANVTVSLQTDPNGSAQIYGTQNIASVGGVASFSGLAIDLPGNGYALRFSLGSLAQIDSSAFNILPLSFSVSSMYPINGNNWMDYVTRNSSGLGNSGSDTACSSNFPACLHAGEIRKVVISGFSSCDGLSMTDQLGIFDWKCDDTNMPVYFFSELKSSKGLKDLVSSTTFNSNKVVAVKDSITVGESTLSAWWSNPISGLTLNSGGADVALNLNTSGTIYTVSSTGTSRGFNLTATKVALAVLGSNTVSNSATLAMDCDSNWPGSQGCIVRAANNQQWVEGNFSLSISGLPVIFTGTSSSLDSLGIRLNNFKLTLSGGALGMYVDGDYGYFSNFEIVAPSGSGTPISLGSGDGNYIKNAKLHGGIYGIYQGNQGWSSTLYNVSISGASSHGMDLSSWYTNIINCKIFNNGGYGINAVTNTYNSLQNTVITSNSGGGISYSNGDSAIRSNIISNNGGIGFRLDTNSFHHIGYYENNIITNNLTGMEVRDYNSTFENLIVTNNTTGIVISGTSTDNKWTGKLTLGNTTADCSITSSGLNPGLATANCNLQGTSDAVRTTGISAVNYFNGSVNSESSNTHTSGTSVASSITDWFKFDNSFRVWGREGSPLDSAIRSQCAAATNCRIWDFRLSSSAAHALEVNGKIDEGLTCPASVHGNVFRTYWSTASNKIYALVHASEIMNDSLGNENGYCESNELCYLNGNLGPYQGLASPSKSCIFQNGSVTNSVTNVKMFGW